MSTVKRPTAQRLARPAHRYYKGKAPKGVDAAALSDDSDEDANEEGPEQQGAGEEEDEEIGRDELTIARDAGVRREEKKMGVKLGRTEIRGGRVIVDGREEVGRTKVEEEEEEEESEKEEEEAEEDEEDEESSEEESEEEEQPKIMFRPVFVAKRQRETVMEKEKEDVNSEEALLKREKEEEERRKQSKALVAESIKRELAEKEAPEAQPDVDDTDGLDPEGEFEAWRLRELARIKRDKEEQLEREREREEVERRRALPEEQRMKEDLEHAKKLREEKPKGQQKFLQKYWHKGAFHQDQEVLKRHDYTEATESTIDVSVLPKVMQVKNFGKRSQTKYTHLLDQDTTAGNGGFGGAAFKGGKGGPGGAGGMGQAGSGSGCFVCGGSHLKKDCPQLARGGPDTASGANSRELGQSKWGPGARGRDERPREGDAGRRPYDGRSRELGRDRDQHRDDRPIDKGYGRRADDRGFRRSKSRSGSPPPRRREDYHDRGRDRGWDRDNDRRDERGGREGRDGRDGGEGYRRRSRSRDMEYDRDRERDKRRRVY